MSSPPVFSGLCGVHSFLCFLCFFIWPLCCLSFFYLQLLITPIGIFRRFLVLCRRPIYIRKLYQSQHTITNDSDNTLSSVYMISFRFYCGDFVEAICIRLSWDFIVGNSVDMVCLSLSWDFIIGNSVDMVCLSLSWDSITRNYILVRERLSWDVIVEIWFI